MTTENAAAAAPGWRATFPGFAYGTSVVGALIAAIPFLVVAGLIWWLGLLGVVLVFLLVVGYVAGLRWRSPECRFVETPAAAKTPPKKRVCVIGGGSSGLCVMKELLAEGHEVVCLERQASLGGIFSGPYIHPAFRFTSSPQITAFSDYRPHPNQHRHWTNHEYIEYLNGYATHFGLWDHIKFGQELVALRWTGDDWTVETREVETGKVRTHEGFDHVAVCTGTHTTPMEIALPEQERYAGKILHSSALRWRADGSLENFDLQGQRVIVMGIGETGADLIDHLLDGGAAQCILSTRDGKGAYVIPRFNKNTGHPLDLDTNRLRNGLPRFIHNRISLYGRPIRAFFGSDPYLQVRWDFLKKSGRMAMNQFATKSDRFIAHLYHGRCVHRPDIAGFSGDTTVRFADGATAEAGLIILCTGYRPAPLPLEAAGRSVETTPAKRYLRMFDLDWRDRIGFIGYARPAIGAIPPTAEMQPRLFALVCSGRRVLPDAETMRTDIDRTGEALQRDFGADYGQKLVNWIPYMDRLATEIGCRLPWSLWWRDPSAALRCVWGGCLVTQYRFVGPGAMPFENAATALKRVPLGMPGGKLFFFCAMHLFGALTDPFALRALRSKQTRCSLF